MAMHRSNAPAKRLAKRCTAAATGPRCQRGFNLVEVLIALLVLAVGLLGLAALQNFSVKNTFQSYQRTQATILIDDIIDRMRANPTAVQAAAYKIGPTSTPPAAPNCMVSVCASGDLVVFDQSEWINAITNPQALGPTAQVTIAQTTVNPITTITVSWFENNVQVSQITNVQLP